MPGTAPTDRIFVTVNKNITYDVDFIYGVYYVHLCRASKYGKL